MLFLAKVKDTTEEDGENYIHIGFSYDHSICGEDTCGGEDREITYLKTGRVTCPRCIDLIDFCKGIREKNINRKHFKS